ncbi:MAG: O-antigen ligase family protein [Patescibacteria group bacterium]
MKFFKRSTEVFLLIFVFLLPWQTKLILRSADNNFNEISLYASQLVLLLALICFFIYKLGTKEPNKKSPLIWYFLGILEVCVLISFFFAPDQLLALYRYIVFLGGLGLFYLVREGINREAYEESCLNRTRIIYIFLTSVFFHSVLAIYQFLSQSSFAFKYLGLASHDPQAFGSSVIETMSGRWLRAYGGLDHPNILGGVLVFALLLSAYLLARKKIINSQLQIWNLVLLFFSYFFALVALFFTFSRTAWIAYFIGMIILAIALMKREERWVSGRFFVLSFFSVMLLILSAVPYRELIFTRLEAQNRLEKISISERKESIVDSFSVIKKYPLFGVGVGNYVKYLEVNDKTRNSLPSQPVHNVFLLVFSENGIFAFSSLFLFIVFLAKSRRRESFSLAVIAAMFVFLMLDHWLFSLPFGILFFFLVLGLI